MAVSPYAYGGGGSTTPPDPNDPAYNSWLQQSATRYVGPFVPTTGEAPATAAPAPLPPLPGLVGLDKTLGSASGRALAPTGGDANTQQNDMLNSKGPMGALEARTQASRRLGLR